MRYFITERVDVDGPEFSESGFEQIGAWVYLMSYCAAQENGGRVEGAKGRKDAFFDRSLKVSRTILEQESQLWTWTEEDLLVHFYSLEAEQSYQKKRESGQRGGKKKAENLAHAKAHAKANALATKPNPTQSHETKEDPTQQNSTESPPGEPASPEEVASIMKEMGGKGLLRAVGVGSGSAVTLEDLFRKIETLDIDPHNRIRAAEIARKLWVDTEEGKRLRGKPVKDLLGLLMHRLQQEHVIKKRK
ncbi:MAG: hypothetical protein VCA73_08950 [Roseibacillus sp.]